MTTAAEARVAKTAAMAPSLRRGAVRAILELGQGFLAEPSNADLRAALTAGQITPADYFQQLLCLVYRLIFLLTVEERGLLHSPESDPAAQRLYERCYGLRRLRDLAVRHSAHDAYIDLYATLKITFRGLASGEPRLALPALGGLFGSEQTPQLDAAALQNRHLLAAIWALAWIACDGATERGQPFPWNPERRAKLRAELDACYARLYGLTRDELRYLLDPADMMGPDYPSETFRVLKNKETRLSGEYRTQRLVLDAWDRLETGALR